MREAMTSHRNEYVETFAKGLDVLKALSAATGPLSVADLARLSGQSRASARRFALTLVRLDYAIQDTSGFSIVPSAAIIPIVDPVTALVLRASPLMNAMVARHGETSSLGVLERGEVRIVAYARSDRLVSMYLDVGDRLPALRAAQGRVLLAALENEVLANLLDETESDTERLREKIEDVRRLGYALVDEELEVGVRSIAVPLRYGRSPDAIAALSLCAHSNRMSPDQLRDRCLSDLMDLSFQLSWVDDQ